jgi:hypothetical protein
MLAWPRCEEKWDFRDLTILRKAPNKGINGWDESVLFPTPMFFLPDATRRACAERSISAHLQCCSLILPDIPVQHHK